MIAGESVCNAGLLPGETVEFELFVNDRLHFFDDFFDSGRKKFTQDGNYHILYVNPLVSANLGPHLRGVLELEAELLFDFHDHAFDDDIEVRNAYLQGMLPGLNWTWFSAGRLAIRTMDGMIYDDNSPAFMVHADFERGFDWPLKLQALVTRIDDDSPYIHADLKYNFAFLESVTFSYGWFRDRDDGIARIFNYLEEERLYQSRGKLHWFGISLKKFLGKFFFQNDVYI